jgi:Restriction endonuclease
MSRQSKKESRALRRRQEAAFRMLALGLLFVLLPLFIGKSPIVAGLKILAPIGWLFLLIGGGLAWLVHDRSPRTPIPAGLRAPLLKPAARFSAITASPPDLVATEIDRMLDGQAAPKLAKTTYYAARTQLSVWSGDVFDAIEWRRFEAVVETLFAQVGFETKTQSHGPDEGVDVWLYSPGRPDGLVGLVQCKHWHDKRVGVDKVRELKGVMASRDVRRGHFATTSTFTPDAKTFAKENGINLLDVDGLLSIIAKRTPTQQQALLEVALEGEYWRPTCVNCGIKMVERTPRAGGAAFWGCTNYPRCKTTMPMRST